MDHFGDFSHLREQFEAEYRILPQRAAGRYEVTACLQEREEKQIYRLQDEEGNSFVLKCAEGSALELLRREAGMLEDVEVDFIPKFVWYEEEEGTGYLLREYVDGITLWEYVLRYGPFELEKALEVMIRICQIVKELHGQEPPVIYRDIKPQNIVLTPDGRLLLIDMGTARFYRKDAEMDTVFIGTRATAAPEQFGYAQTDGRADIYGMGKLFCYLLTGDVAADSAALQKISGRCAAVIRKCTKFSPDERYRDASELEKSLKRCRIENIRRRRRLAAHGAAALVLAASLILLPDFGRDSRISAPEVEFSSSLLEEAVRRELHREEGAPVYEEDLKEITQLLICGNRVFDDYDSHEQYYREHRVDGQAQEKPGDIRDISVISRMENLKYLVLDNQSIQDISPLSGLSLEYLSLCRNPLRDLEPLKSCPWLRDLRLEETAVSDLTPLSSMYMLNGLDCGSTNVESLTPLTGLSLYRLILVETPVTDYSVLGDLPLKRLVVWDVGKDTVRQIGTMAGLEELTIYSSGIENIDELTGLTRLKSLDLAANRVSTIAGAGAFEQLERLCVEDNPISDLSPLKDCKNMRRLEAEYTQVEDYSVLKELLGLQELVTNEGKRETVEAAVPEPWFSVTYLPDPGE